MASVATALGGGGIVASEAQQWSIITVTHNSEAQLRTYWREWEPPANVEWVVVDNGSTDSSVGVARALGARVIPLTRNVGFGQANNIGFDLSRGDIVAFVNPDVSVVVEDLPSLACAIEQRPGLYAPQLVNPDGTLQPNGRGAPQLWSKVRHRLRPNSAGTYRVFADQGETKHAVWLTGAVVASTRRIFLTLGPWDDYFFLYYEDTDLGLRASQQGLPSVVLGDLRWVHGWARETISLNWNAWRRELASLVKFYARYPTFLFPFEREAP